MGILDMFSGRKPQSSSLVDVVVGMRSQGMDDNMIVQQLQGGGAPLNEIQDAMMQADIKMRVATPQMGQQQMQPMGYPPQFPSPQYGGPPQQYPNPQEPTQGYEPQGLPAPVVPATEELVEKIVSEKWKSVEARLEDFEKSKGEIMNDLKEMKDAVNRVQGRYVNQQQESTVKLEEYNKELEGVGAQIKAMQRVMQNILPALTENIRQLNDIVKEMKGNRLPEVKEQPADFP